MTAVSARHARRLAPLVPALLLAGCALHPKPTPAMGDLVQRLQAQPVAALVDACVVRDEVGRDYMLRDATQIAGSNTLLRLQTQAEANGITIADSLWPFECGALSPELGRDLEVAQTMGGPDLGQRLPLARDRALSADAARAANRLLQALSEGGVVDADAPRLLSLSPTEVALLREQVQADYLLVAASYGIDVSGAKSFGTGLLTGLASALITGGAYIATTAGVDTIVQTVAVVDLAKGMVAWKPKMRSSRGDPADPQRYHDGARMALLTPLLPQEGFSMALGPSEPPPLAVAGAGAASAATAPQASEPRDLYAPAPPPPAPVPFPQSLQSPAALTLQGRPLPGDEPLHLLPAGSAVVVQRETDGRHGAWWYVQAGRAQGWTRARPEWLAP